MRPRIVSPIGARRTWLIRHTRRRIRRAWTDLRSIPAVINSRGLEPDPYLLYVLNGAAGHRTRRFCPTEYPSWHFYTACAQQAPTSSRSNDTAPLQHARTKGRATRGATFARGSIVGLEKIWSTGHKERNRTTRAFLASLVSFLTLEKTSDVNWMSGRFCLLYSNDMFMILELFVNLYKFTGPKIEMRLSIWLYQFFII